MSFLFNGCASFPSLAHCTFCVTMNLNDTMSTYSDFSFRGLAGAIFICLVFASILYVIGFATTAWAINKTQTGQKLHEGLWERCTCHYNKDIPREGKSLINIYMKHDVVVHFCTKHRYYIYMCLVWCFLRLF